MAQDLMQWLKISKPVSSLYYVIGEELFLLQKIKQSFISRVLGDSDYLDFNYDSIEASSANVAKLIATVDTLPLLDEKRLVFCYSAQNFKEADWEKLQVLFEDDSSSLVLVFFFNKLDQRKKISKKLSSCAEKLEAGFLSEWQLGPWIDFISDSLNLKFNKENQKLLHNLVGCSLGEIETELKKLKSYIGDRVEVQQEDILSCISRARVDKIFELTNHIGRKDRVQALNCLARLIENNQNPFGALALIARHMRILSRVKDGLSRGLKNRELQIQSTVSPYFLKNYLAQADLWTEDQIERTMLILKDTNKALKSSYMSDHVWLESFILESCA